MKHFKIKAFTLSEMLVVLVIASLVISMAFSLLTMVREQVVLIQSNYLKKQQIYFFETTLLRDFNNHRATFNVSKNQLLLMNSKDTINYNFFSGFVLREKDTFPLEILNKKLFLDGVETKEGVLDALEINLTQAYASKQLFIQTTKDAAYYINK